MQGLLDDLVASGYMFSPSEAMCLVQVRKGLAAVHCVGKREGRVASWSGNRIMQLT